MDYLKSFCTSEDSNVQRMLSPSPDELAGLSNSIRKLRSELRSNPSNVVTHFQLGVALVSHSRLSFVNEGVSLLERVILINLDDKFARSPMPVADHETSSFDRSDTSSAGTVQSYQINSRDHSTSASSSYVNSATTHMNTVPAAPDPSVSSGSSSLHKTASGRAGEGNSRNSAIDDISLYYYLAIGNIKLGQLNRALHCLDQILRTNPAHQQVIAMRSYIENKMKRDKAADVAAVTGTGVAIAGAAALCAMMLSRRK